MKLKFRIDDTNPKHTRLTVFQDGANCGQLCMDTIAVRILFDSLNKHIPCSDLLQLEFPKQEGD